MLLVIRLIGSVVVFGSVPSTSCGLQSRIKVLQMGVICPQMDL